MAAQLTQAEMTQAGPTQADAGRIRARFRGRLGGFALAAELDLPAIGVSAIFGPSGCGKTTVARCIAGLHHLPDGRCIVDGEVWQDGARFRRTHQRPIGYVFQEASLFAHLCVRRNLLYGAPRDPSSQRVSYAEVVSLLGLSPLLERMPQHLSGGERQRVAIGRALLSQPRLLLMDEPLSALDHDSRGEILPFLERLHRLLALPVIYISHDITEIERLADHLVLMRDGRVIAAGPLAALQSDPTLPLATAREAAVSLDGVIAGHNADDELLTLQIGTIQLQVPAPAAPIGQPQRLQITARDVSIALVPPQQASILNVLPARIVAAAPAGCGEIVAVLALDGSDIQLLARITRRSWNQLGLRTGRPVYAQVKGVSLV